MCMTFFHLRDVVNTVLDKLRGALLMSAPDATSFGIAHFWIVAFFI